MASESAISYSPSSTEMDVEAGKEMTESGSDSAYVRFIKTLRGKKKGQGEEEPSQPTLWQQCLAEAVGTGIIVIAGVGSVNAAVFTGAQAGLWQVAVVWGFGVTLAILTTATISGAHLNPAVSLAFALLRPEDFPFSKLIPYWVSQMLGAMVAASINLLIYGTSIFAFEQKRSINRGDPESVLSAMAFGEYFPNPAFQYTGDSAEPLGLGGLEWTSDTVNPWGSFGIEAWGTGILMFVILAVTDSRNTAFVSKEMAPFFIGFTVSTLISLYAPLNQAGFNPARDFGPRLISYFAGWGSVAIPGPNNGFWTYILGPLVGAPIGGAFYEFVLMRGM